MEDEVQTVPGGNRTTLDGDGVSPDSRRDEHAARGDSQASRGVKGDGVDRVEAERVDRDRRAADGGQSTVVDVRAGHVRGGVSPQLGGLTRRGGRKAAASAGCGPAADDGARGSIVRVEDQGAARAVLGRQEIDARTSDRAGDQAEIQGQRDRGSGGEGGTRTARQKRRGGEGLRVRPASLSREIQDAAAELQRAHVADDGGGRSRQVVEVEAERAAEDGGLAGVIRAIDRRERQRARAHLDEPARAERADGADAAVDETGEFGAIRARDGEIISGEVEDTAGRHRAADVRSLDGRDGDVTIELGDIADGVIPIKDIASGGAVDAVAHVERVGVIEQESAD